MRMHLSKEREKKEPKVLVIVRVERAVRDAVLAKAQHQDETLSQVVRRGLRAYVEGK